MRRRYRDAKVEGDILDRIDSPIHLCQKLLSSFRLSLRFSFRLSQEFICFFLERLGHGELLLKFRLVIRGSRSFFVRTMFFI